MLVLCFSIINVRNVEKREYEGELQSPRISGAPVAALTQISTAMAGLCYVAVENEESQTDLLRT